MVGVYSGGCWEGEEVWVFPADGGESDMCVLEVWACVPFEGEHAFPVEGIIVDTNIQVRMNAHTHTVYGKGKIVCTVSQPYPEF